MPRASLRCLLRGELRKMILQRSNWALPVVAIGFGLAVANGAGEAAPPTLGTFQLALDTFRAFAAAAVGVTILAVSAQLVATEYHYGTARVVIGRGAGRLRTLGAKIAAVALAGLALLIVLAIAGAIDLMFRLAQRPAQVRWSEIWLSASVVLLSALVCAILGAAAGAIGRSMTFAMAVVAGFFPADNLLNYVLQLIQNATQEQIWGATTAYLLGPTLNQLPAVLMQRSAAQLPGPESTIDPVHAFAVVGAYVAILLTAAVTATSRRDITN